MSAETWAVSGDMMARDVELTATLVKLGRTRRMFGVEIAGTASGALDFDRSLDVGGDAQVSDVPGEASLDASLSTSITFSKPACGGAQAAACAARGLLQRHRGRDCWRRLSPRHQTHLEPSLLEWQCHPTAWRALSNSPYTAHVSLSLAGAANGAPPLLDAELTVEYAYPCTTGLVEWCSLPVLALN